MADTDIFKGLGRAPLTVGHLGFMFVVDKLVLAAILSSLCVGVYSTDTVSIETRVEEADVRRWNAPASCARTELPC